VNNDTIETSLEEIDDFAKQIREITLETTRSLNMKSNQNKSKEEQEEEKEQRIVIDIINAQLSRLRNADRREIDLFQVINQPVQQVPTAELYKRFKEDVQQSQEDLNETERMMEKETEWPEFKAPNTDFEIFRPKVDTDLYKKVKNDLLTRK
jgi:hypothetical protein